MEQPIPQNESLKIQQAIDEAYIYMNKYAADLKTLRSRPYGWEDGVFWNFYKFFYLFFRMTWKEDKIKTKIKNMKYKDRSIVEVVNEFFSKTQPPTGVSTEVIDFALDLSEKYEEALYEIGGISWK